MGHDKDFSTATFYGDFNGEGLNEIGRMNLSQAGPN